jgi:FdrA protein
MVIKGITKRGEYFDSVSLMLVARELTSMEGIQEAAVVMGTAENKAILETSGLLLPEFAGAGDTDLLIGGRADDERALEQAFQQVETLLKNLRRQHEDTADFLPKSLDGAVQSLPGAKLALISVAGQYAADEAMQALQRGLHVMLFSDNVPLAREIELKTYARQHGLLVMGPDCGTAILNGVPLGFANVVNRGDIGIVAASGTGLQEVSCVISNQGGGVSQAIGTGGRDVSQEVDGIMFLESLKALKEDEATNVIVLIAKPPHEEVLRKIAAELEDTEKPVVAMFVGAQPALVKEMDVLPVAALDEAGRLAVALSQGTSLESVKTALETRTDELRALAAAEAEKHSFDQPEPLQEPKHYISGLFSGGTLCDEAQMVLRPIVGDVYSNTPLDPAFKLDDAWKDREHTVIDLGDDEFTVGRPHPMIDFSLRNGRILEEAQDPDVAVILLDVVLGYGAHPRPAEELAPFIKQARDAAQSEGRYLSVVCSVTGTERDPQNKPHVVRVLQEAGALVMPSNAAACELAGYIC